jgi:hypothetical protein
MTDVYANQVIYLVFKVNVYKPTSPVHPIVTLVINHHVVDATRAIFSTVQVVIVSLKQFVDKIVSTQMVNVTVMMV